MPTLLQSTLATLVPSPQQMSLGLARSAVRPTLQVNGFLADLHPVYAAQLPVWLANERRALGAPYVLQELVPFDWEDPAGDRYRLRQAHAVYPGWPDQFLSRFIGHLMRQRPEPGTSLSFGTLGEVARKRDRDTPTDAELLYYNADGLGSGGSQWDGFYARVMRKAATFGHCWTLAEGPPEPVTSRGQVFRGLRPFLADLSPISVTNWHYENGRLMMAVVRRRVRRLVYDPRGLQAGGAYVSGAKEGYEYLLLTAAGFQGFGPFFRDGGWFVFDPEGTFVDGGDDDVLEGEIPLAPLFYERLSVEGHAPTMSRPAITDMGQVSVAAMNVDSASHFNAWDAGSNIKVVMNADSNSFRVLIDRLTQGTHVASYPRSEDAEAPPATIESLAGSAVPSEVFRSIREGLSASAEGMMMSEMHSAPYASGQSKQISWADSRAPRLAAFAEEVETNQNWAIPTLERLWGNRRPEGVVQWRRDFDLLDPVATSQTYFQLGATAKMRSPTLDAEIMLTVARSMGVVNDTEKEDLYRQELLESAKLAQQQPAPGAGGEVPGQPGPPGGQGNTRQPTRELRFERDEGGNTTRIIAN